MSSPKQSFVPKLGKLVVSTCLLFAATIAAAAWYFTDLIMHPAPAPCPQDHYVYCDTPAELGMAYEEIQFKTEDGLTLSAWWIPGNRQADSAILMVHGHNASRHEAMRDADALHQQGHSLLLIDLRHSGKSDPSFISMGYHERKDIHAAVNYLKEERSAQQIGIVGYSMGAATAIMAMAENDQIQAGWFDSSFTDLDSVIQFKGEQEYGIPPNPVLSGVVRSLYEWRGQLNTETPTPLNRIGDIAPRPVMIIHGTADQVTPVAHAHELYEAAQAPKALWIIPDGKHTQAWQADREKAQCLMTAFFGKHLREESAQGECQPTHAKE